MMTALASYTGIVQKKEENGSLAGKLVILYIIPARLLDLAKVIQFLI